MSLEDRVTLLEKTVSELQSQLAQLKQLIFESVVTIDQAQNLF